MSFTVVQKSSSDVVITARGKVASSFPSAASQPPSIGLLFWCGIERDGGKEEEEEAEEEEE
jgi:hypothetical protein